MVSRETANVKRQTANGPARRDETAIVRAFCILLKTYNLKRRTFFAFSVWLKTYNLSLKTVFRSSFNEILFS